MQQTMWATILALVIYLASSLGGGNTGTPGTPGWPPASPSSPPASGQSSQVRYGVVGHANATLRSAPSTSSRSLASVAKGTQLTIMGSSGEWYNVALSSGSTGWMAKWLVTPSNRPPSFKTGKTEVIGYYVENNAGDKLALDSLRANSQTITTAIPFFYSMNAGGWISGHHNQAPITFAKSKGIRTLAAVHNATSTSFSGNVVHTLLRSSAARKQAIASIGSLLKKHGYDGVNIDFENVWPSDRPYLTQFFRELAWALRPKGYLVTAAIPAKTNDARNDNWSGAFDYGAIAPYLDYVILMTYDEHYAKGPAGPVASIGWVRNVLKYATSVMPREKVIMGLATYGYEWSGGSGRAVSFGQVSSRVKTYKAVPKWDNYSQSPYFYYWRGRAKYTVWYENNYSIAAKLPLVKEFGLRGVALWRLGIEDPATWKRIQAGL